MKKIIITLVSVFLLVLTSCQTVGEGSAEDVFNFRQDNWSLVHDSDFSAIKEVYVPESYNGYTYQEVLALALSKIDDPYYELVWGEPTVISPNGEYAQLPNPLIDNAKNVNAVDFYWEGTNLEVQYIVDDLVQEWSYHF